jgi:gliding motility-associated-like protein
VELIVEDSLGCRDTAQRVIEVRPGPTAGFAADDSIGCPPFPVQFTGNGGMGIIQWDWDFGDGSSGSGQVVSHTYTSSGTYTVTLVVTDTLGCTDTITRLDYIHISPPVADFGANQTSGCAPLTVVFSDSTVSDTTLVNWQWDFGDGNTGTGTPVSHTYTAAGTYTVTLIVTDIVGCMDTAVRVNYITVFAAPNAGFLIADTVACDPFTIELQDTSSGAAPIIGWQWDFGDGGTSSAQNPVHAYTAGPGNYLITLIVTDANGCADTTLLPLTVPVRPQAYFVALDSLGCAPFPVTFVADSVDIISWSWNFGDGNTANTGPVVTHLYPNRGRYTVSLIIEDIYGCFDTLVRPNYIFVDSVIADFSFTTSIGCPPLQVSFTDLSQSDTLLVGWQWSFGDGGTSNLPNPTHTYTTPGNYQVTLVVTNALGCTDSAVSPIITVYDLIPPPVPPIYMVTVLRETRDSISWMSYQGPDFSHYVLYRENPTGSNSWLAIDSFFNVNDTIFVDQGLNTLNNSYCYKLQVVDVCGLRSSLDSSRKHCTMDVEAFAGILQANITWTPYVGWDSIQSYQIFRVSDWNPANAVVIGQVPGNVTAFNDTSFNCHEEYCYRIEAIEAGGFNQVSWSDTSCAAPIYFPNQLPAYLCSATVEADSFVRVSWTNIPVSNVVEFYLEKSRNGTVWNLLAVLPNNVFDYLDTDVDVHSQSYYYRVSFLDSCGDVSPLSNIGRTIYLQGTLQSVPFLTWNAYEIWDQGVREYQLEVFQDATQLWIPAGQTPETILQYLDNQTQFDQIEYCYHVTGYERNGDCQSLSNKVCVPVGPLIYAPNAFTPNGDGTNDFFIVKGWFVAEYNVQIFDRWGKLIFESNSMDVSWDGRFGGQDCQEGVYVWVIRGRGYDDTILEFTGTATLIR